MPVLKNSRHEKFAQNVAAKGMSASEAYRKAGYKADTGAAARLSANVSVAARIQELKERHADRAEISAERVLREIASIAFANQDDFSEWGPDGVTLKDSTTLTREQKATVAEVSQTVTKDGGTIRYKLHDKNAALANLARHLGLFKDGNDAPHGGIHLHLHGSDANL